MTFYAREESLVKISSDLSGTNYGERKIKHFYNSELPLLIEQGYMVAGVAPNSCGVAAGGHNHNNNSNNKSSAGSGNFVTSSRPRPQEGGEGNISNPRVLSDMGFAILMQKTLKII